ncbi:uncharacterized protein N7459_006891 [Penicillium hispanicum]|uniref:uncharacterized protein n=1 Tax=Penicillium hispanicum TaxID=1080232 RepID=UPI002541D2A5|nr:uncharacterized protein N7459_006891 [Penicillium hispanicum]KAJ5577927.1 hypothetical protein N7459_006891 [Penicillium hispanicum]
MQQLLLKVLSFPFYIITNPVTTPVSTPNCKSSPHNDSWPSVKEWNALNQSIGGSLLQTVPAASSCYDGNPFNSPYNCSDVRAQWRYGISHTSWPESIHYTLFTNNSCIPPGVDGYSKTKGCSITGLPRYIVNATKEEQVRKAMKWASERDIRIVIKSTGHDFNGRSTGANSLSIWTHHFNHIKHDNAWHIPGSNETANVLICGGGVIWASAYAAANKIHRAVIGSEDVTVGLGGLLQNGGHGVLSSHHGLGSDQVYQATVITSDGRRLVANDEQNQDLFWAIRGGGGGQFGVVTEFVIRTLPKPANMVTGGLFFCPRDKSDASETASWAAYAETASQLPDLVDEGITGTVSSMIGQMAVKYSGLKEAVPGPAITMTLMTFNSTTGHMRNVLTKLATKVSAASDGNLNLSVIEPLKDDFWWFNDPDVLISRFAGSARLFTSRLLGRPELSDLPRKNLTDFLKQIPVAEDPEEGTLVRWDIQAGPGPAEVPEKRRGSVLPAWRTAYSLTMTWGASMNSTEDPSKALAAAAEWYENVKEPVWREWAPDGGTYRNAGNGLSRTWKQDFYGDNYDKLLKIKRKYDPSESLFVYSGLGSDRWNYDLHSGLLCRVDRS